MTADIDAGVVGRDQELSVLLGALDRLVAGRGGVAWVEGEPGIGKSALVRVVLAKARRSGCVVRAGGGDELAGGFPLRLLADCLGVGFRSDDALTTEIARLLRGDLAATDAVDPIGAAGERMLELVDRLCAAGPVVLAAEDLHWADEATLSLWSRLARSVDQIPLLLVGSCRPVPRRAALERLGLAVRASGGAVVRLGPLSAADVTDVVSGRLGALPGPKLTRELVRAGGNPLYLHELTDALVADGSVRVAGGVAEVVAGAETTPTSFVAALGRRLGFLSEQTLKALRLAALLGVEFGLAEWAAVAQRTPAELGETVEEATTAGVIVDRGVQLAFRHDLVRQVLLEQTPPALRVWIHRDVARRLAEVGSEAHAVASHLLAGPALDDWALTWLADVPETMVYTAPAAFEELLLRAISHVDAGDARWEVLASQLAQVQYRMGHDEPAAETSMAVLRHTTNVELAGQMRLQAVRARGRQAQFDAAVALARPALDDPTVPSHWRARLRAWAAQGIYVLGDRNEGKRQALLALDEALACGDRLGVGYARFNLMVVSRGDTSNVRADLILAELGDDAESADLRVMILGESLRALEGAGATEEVDRLLPQALVAAERLGTARSYWIPAWALAFSYGRGDWDEALRYAAIIPDTIEPLAPIALGLRAEVFLRRDQRELADQCLQTAGVPDRIGDPPFSRVIRELAFPLMLRASVDGDNASAVALGKDLLDHPLPHITARLMVHLVRSALELGDVATARAATEFSKTMPEETGTRCCQALLDNDAQALLDAAAFYAGRGWRTLQAFALEEAAVQMAHDGKADSARAPLTQAIQIYTDFGATMDVRRAKARLRPFGIRLGPRGVYHRADHGWQSLTPAEERVAALVGEGLSNPDIAARLFLSRATVQTHVSRILLKLNIKSRIELIKGVRADAH